MGISWEYDGNIMGMFLGFIAKDMGFHEIHLQILIQFQLGKLGHIKSIESYP
jgi:hypothetical protein